MEILQNLHTHSTFCDGADSPEEIIETAIDKGFSGVGFSSHSYMHFSTGKSMPVNRETEYKKEISVLKEKYKGKIDIRIALECESFPQ